MANLNLQWTDGWQSTDLAGKRVEYMWPHSASPRFAVLYLHSFQGEAPSQRTTWTDLFVSHGIACISPSGGRCWWSDRICPEFDEHLSPEAFILENVVPWVQARWNLPPRRLAIFGVDMGGQGALRMAFKYPRVFPIVAAIAPSIEYHELYWSGLALDEMYRSKEECRQDTAPMHINPYDYPPHIFFAADPDDPWWRGSDRLREKLAALGITHHCDLVTRAGGHTWAYFDSMAPRAIQFLFDSLERESRRLV